MYDESNILLDGWLIDSTIICLTQVDGESNVLLDGSLIDLCGAVLLWCSAEALKEMAVYLVLFFF